MMHSATRFTRSLLARAGTLAVFVAVSATQASAQRATLETMVRDTVLANGLHVIVVRNATVPIATIEVVVRTGAFSQLTAADEGVPHLLEHMLFRSDGGWFFEAFSKAEGLAYNGLTDTEAVAYYVTLPAKNLEKGVKLMADLVRSPNFKLETLKEEQKVVNGEIQRKSSEPQYLMHFQSSSALWGEGWRRKNPGGNVLAVNATTTDQLKGFVGKYYIPNNSAVVVSGDVNAPEVFALAAKSFASWKAAEDPLKATPMAPMPPLKATRTGVVEADVTDLTFLIRWQGPSVGTDPGGTYAADVFAELINQPLSGLQRRLVDTGLFQSVSVNYETLRNVGPIELVARTTAENVEAAGAALKKEIRQFGTPGYFTDEDVAIAKKRQQVLSAFQLEAPSTLAHPIATLWSSAGLDYYMGYVDNVRAQTPADVQRFVDTYLAGKPMVLTVLLSSETRRAVRAPLDAILSKWSVE